MAAMRLNILGFKGYTMRKIEQQTIDAIKARKDWRCSNMGVFYETAGNPFGPRSEIYLHGNHIADYWHVSGELDIDTDTLKRWPSNTTLSRLRALGANVRRCKGVILLNDEPLKG